MKRKGHARKEKNEQSAPPSIGSGVSSVYLMAPVVGCGERRLAETRVVRLNIIALQRDRGPSWRLEAENSLVFKARERERRFDSELREKLVEAKDVEDALILRRPGRRRTDKLWHLHESSRLRVRRRGCNRVAGEEPRREALGRRGCERGESVRVGRPVLAPAKGPTYSDLQPGVRQGHRSRASRRARATPR